MATITTTAPKTTASISTTTTLTEYVFDKSQSDITFSNSGAYKVNVLVKSLETYSVELLPGQTKTINNQRIFSFKTNSDGNSTLKLICSPWEYEEDQESVSRNSIVAQLEKMANKTAWVIPEMFDIGGGDSASIQAAIYYCIANSVNLSFIPNKTYTLNAKLFINGKINIDFKNATFKTTFNGFAIEISSTYKNGCFMSNLVIDCDNIGSGILATEAYRTYFNNITIINCPTFCFKHLVGYEVFLNVGYFKGTTTQTIGIYAGSGDCHYTDIVMLDVNTPIFEVNGKGNFYTRIHPWIVTPALLRDSCFAHFGGYSDSMFVECYGDTVHKCLIFDTTAGAKIRLIGFRYNINATVYNQDAILAAENSYFVYYNAITEEVYENRLKFIGVRGENVRSNLLSSNLTKYWFGFDNSSMIKFSDVTDCRSIKRQFTASADVLATTQNVARNKLGVNHIIFKGSVTQKTGSFSSLITVTDLNFSVNESTVIPVYFSTTSEWTLTGVGYGYIQTDAATSQTKIDVQIPPTIANGITVYLTINYTYLQGIVTYQ